MCFRTKVSATIGDTNNQCRPSQNSEICWLGRGAEAAGSPTASDTLTINSEVKLKPKAATTPRVSGDLNADVGQQRLWFAQQVEQSTTMKKAPGRGLVKSRHRKLHHRGPTKRIRKYPSGWRWKNKQGASLLEVLSSAPTTVSRYRRHLEHFLYSGPTTSGCDTAS